MKKLIRVKSNKILLLIIIIVFISFLIGILFPAFLSKNNINLLNNSLTDFFMGIKENRLNYQEAFFSSIFINIFTITLVWILGISIIGYVLIIGILAIHSFILGFSFSSILSIYGFKGIILAIIYIVPNFINLFVLIILSYYAINFSFMLYFYLFKQKEYNKRLIVKRYIRILIFSFIIMIFSSIIEIFLLPSIIKILI